MRAIVMFCALLVTVSAQAGEVLLTGVVTDLSGTPLIDPVVTVTVKTFGGTQLASQPVDRATARFEIKVDAARLPRNDVRLAISAEGKATVGTVRADVATDSDMIGMAGFLPSGAAGISSAAGIAEYRFTVVVPKAKAKGCVTCYPRRGFRHRTR